MRIRLYARAQMHAHFTHKSLESCPAWLPLSTQSLADALADEYSSDFDYSALEDTGYFDWFGDESSTEWTSSDVPMGESPINLEISGDAYVMVLRSVTVSRGRVVGRADELFVQRMNCADPTPPCLQRTTRMIRGRMTTAMGTSSE